MGKWKMVSFDSVFEDVTRYGTKIKKEDYLAAGLYPIIDQGKEPVAGYTNNSDGIYNDVPVVLFGDHTRIVKYVDLPLFLGADGVKLLHLTSIKNSTKFMYYCLSSARIPDTGYNRHFKWLKELTFPEPPLDIQKKIANVLDKASALIELRKAQLGKLDLLIKSQFIEMFGDPEDNPKEWLIKTLEQLFLVRSSKRVYQNEQTNAGVPFLRISDLVQIIEGGTNTCSLYISEEQFQSFINQSLVPKPQDILVTTRGTLGLCYIVGTSDRFYFQDGMISWLDRKSAHINSIYIKYLFETNSLKRQIKEVSSGTTVNYLSLEKLKRLKIMYPEYALQNQFASFVEKVEAQKKALQQSLSKLELNYKSLMQKCFRGEIF